MDAKILNYIIDSTTIPSKSELLNEGQCEKDVVEFPATSSIAIDGLSKSLTKLLTYKVSQEAYQRYSVRLNIIEQLRNWSRLKGDIGSVLQFQDSEKSHAFLIYLLKKYMKPENLSMCNDIDHLIQTAQLLLNSIEKYRSLMKCFVKVIERILSLNQTKNSEQFLKHVIHKSNDLHIELSLVEQIFLNLKFQLVEKPLTDCFMEYCLDKKKKVQLSSMNTFFKKVIDSSLLFLLISNLLKELLVETKFSDTAQSFIKEILERIYNQCNECHYKDILDLYPANLQYCVILLRINPIDHSKKSKKKTVQSLQDIFLNDYNDALILVSHFPEWLPMYIELSQNLDEIVQKSNVN